MYLLNEHCRLSNRQAIRLWNKELGTSRGLAYTMEEAEADLQGANVSQSGEANYSKAKGELKKRIASYQSALTTRTTGND